jgi:hypothetical protein
MRATRILKAVLSTLAIILPFSAIAAEPFSAEVVKSGPFTAVSIYVDKTMAPQSVGDVAAQIGKDPAVSALASAALSYVGVPPAWTKIALTAAVAAEGAPDDELQHIAIVYPPGYRYCKSIFETISLVGGDGSGYEVYALWDAIDIHYWAKKLPITLGRSWVEFKGNALMIKEESLPGAVKNGSCTDTRLSLPTAPVANKIKVLHCTGGSCGNYER